jgi:hypothetical protein
MLAGMLPFSGDAIEVMYSNTKLDAPPISERNPEVEVSVEMQAIVCKLMARNPDERFESARDVLTVLGALAGSDASPDAGESLAMVVASQSTKLRESEVRDQETPTVKNGAAIAADTILAAPAAPTAVARKTKTLTYAVGGVFALALAVFALLKFGGGEAQIAADREQVEPPAEALAGSEPSGTEITKVFEPEPATLSDLEALATPHDAGSLEVVETPASKDAPNPQSLTKSEIRAKRRKERRLQDLAADKFTSSSTAKPTTTTVVDTKAVVVAPVPDKIEVAPPLPDPLPPKPVEKPVVKVVPKPAPVVPKVFDAVTSISGFSAKGSLSSNVVRRAVDRALPTFRSCYKSAARKSKKNKAGSLKLSFQINELGRASNIKVGSYPLSGLSQCVSKGLKTVRTRMAPDVGTVRVSLSLKFAAK